MILVAAAPAQVKNLLPSISSHAYLGFLVQLALLLACARVLGELMRRWGQPGVVGELAAGLLLGPSVLGALSPETYLSLFPQDPAHRSLLSVVSRVGVLFLLLVTGLELDLKLIVARARTAVTISYAGIVLPVLTGIALGLWVVPDELLVEPDKRWVFSLFLGVALSIAAIPVLAKILLDLNLLRRELGQITLAAAMCDDLNGWVLLSVVAGLSLGGPGTGPVVATLTGAVLFLGLSFSLGRVLVDRVLGWVDDHVGGPAAQLSTLLIMMLSAAAVTQALGLEAILGAFVVGILAGQSRRTTLQTTQSLELLASSFFAPLFFATAGLKVNLPLLLNPGSASLAVILFAATCLSKMVGIYLGCRLAGLSHWERLTVASGMTALGSMGTIIAAIGLQLGLVGPEVYAMIIAVAVGTSMLAPPMLRFCFARVEVSDQERARLAREALARDSFVLGLSRVLLPSRGGANALAAARILRLMNAYHKMDVTALYVKEEPNTGGTPDEALAGVREILDPRIRVDASSNPQAAILREAGRSYDLLVVGASEGPPEGHSLFGGLADGLIQNSPCPSLAVRSGPAGARALTDLRRILVPTAGTQYGRHAVEVAAVLGAGSGALVTILHVLAPSHPEQVQRSLLLQKMQPIAEEIVDHQADLARKLGAQVDTRVELAEEPGREILRLAEAENFDLIVLGSNLRPLTGRVFFGHRVEHILRHAPCAVAVVSSP